MFIREIKISVLILSSHPVPMRLRGGVGRQVKITGSKQSGRKPGAHPCFIYFFYFCGWIIIYQLCKFIRNPCHTATDSFSNLA